MVVFLMAGMLLLSGCAYTKTQMPLDKDFEDTRLGDKQGRASAKMVLFLVAWGDSGTRAAALDGGITVIKHADREIFSVLFGLYTRITTVVYGE
ncbi:TRL-like family protein [Thermodesulfobacteriota bacterium]